MSRNQLEKQGRKQWQQLPMASLYLVGNNVMGNDDSRAIHQPTGETT